MQDEFLLKLLLPRFFTNDFVGVSIWVVCWLVSSISCLKRSPLSLKDHSDLRLAYYFPLWIFYRISSEMNLYWGVMRGTKCASWTLSLSSFEYSTFMISTRDGLVFLSHWTATRFIMEMDSSSCVVLTIFSTLTPAGAKCFFTDFWTVVQKTVCVFCNLVSPTIHSRVMFPY